MSSKQIHQPPFTERSNPLSSNIDVASPNEIIAQIYACEKEIFSGWNDLEGVYGKNTVDALGAVADRIISHLKEEDGYDRFSIVISGCGTSGRLAFMIARTFNQLAAQLGLPQCFHYLIAGGDIALLTSREAPEDNPFVGKTDLQELCGGGTSRVLYVGVTCGLSAPYVAGQLAHCMDHPDTFTPLLLGFNPVPLARNVPIEGWDRTFYDVCLRLEKLADSKDGFIINPTIGPEPITGSSRMKGGSATKILLESLFLYSLVKSSELGTTISHEWSIKHILDVYKHVQEECYRENEQLSNIVQAAGDSMNQGGRLKYFGFDQLGIVGMIDASECPPTYGSDVNDVRAFLEGGYQLLNNRAGSLEDEFALSMTAFGEQFAPTIRTQDLAILLCTDGMCHIPQSSDGQAIQCPIFILNFLVNKKNMVPIGDATCVDIHLPWKIIEEYTPTDVLPLFKPFLVEFACKMICNVISTGGHILKGKVYQNFMVDVKVSNSKLFHRAIGIIQRLSDCTKEEAFQYLLRSVYKTNALSSAVLEMPVSLHITAACSMEKVVPLALIMAITKWSVEDSRNQLEQSPIIRTVITKCLNPPQA